MGEWFEDLFDDRYLEFYEGDVAVAPAEGEARFLDRALALDPGSRILDLGCGFGRHAVALARLGHRVTGVDLSARLLEHATVLAQSTGVEVSFERRDMRKLDGLGPFDACVCLYTVLGYFDDADNERVVRGVRDVLAPGGQFVLDLTNPLAAMRSWPGDRWRELPSVVTRETTRYDAVTGHVISERMFFRSDGTRVQLPTSSVRMYAPSEAARLLRDAGFEIDQLYGTLGDEPFRWDRSPKQVWIARKSTGA